MASETRPTRDRRARDLLIKLIKEKKATKFDELQREFSKHGIDVTTSELKQYTCVDVD